MYALSARPGTVQREIAIELPDRTYHTKRQPRFQDYKDEIMGLLRGEAAVEMAVAEPR